MTRKALAAASGVSERYLAQLEAGQGNISVLLLRKVAHAMDVAVDSLVREEPDQDAGPAPHRPARPARRRQVHLGAKLAAALGVPFVELDREVEREAGAKLGEVFAMYGQEAFRRFERRALERVLRTHERAVIAAGGSLVTDPDTYRLLLDNCRTRLAQGEARGAHEPRHRAGRHAPVQGHASAALDEIRKLLADRDRLYSRADVTIETSGKSLKASLEELKAKVKT